MKLGAVLGRLPEGNNELEGTFLGVRGYSTQPIFAKSFALEFSFWGQTNSSINFFRGGDAVGGELAFNAGRNVERMRISGNGNVGIGTSSPDAKLAVNGTIHAKEVKVDLNIAAPDYVFKPDYKLIPLISLKAYIKRNSHLPEVPSASQMEMDGINLGDMNLMLLKKIEELTLYLLEKDGQIETHSERLKQQQEEIIVLKQQVRKANEQEDRIALLEARLERLMKSTGNSI